MNPTKMQSRSALLLTTVVSCVVIFLLVYLDARRASNPPMLSRFILALAVLSAPLIGCVAAWPRLSASFSFGGRQRPLVASLMEKLGWRRRSRSNRRTEHRRQMHQLLIEYASRHKVIPASGSFDRNV